MSDDGKKKPPREPDLFDVAAAKAAKKEGMDRVARGANPAWTRAMIEYVNAVCRTHQRFTTDDVWLHARAMGMKETTRDNRAMGPVMSHCAKAGMCRKALVPEVPSQRKLLHSTPIQVWDSLIYEGPALAAD